MCIRGGSYEKFYLVRPLGRLVYRMRRTGLHPWAPGMGEVAAGGAVCGVFCAAGGGSPEGCPGKGLYDPAAPAKFEHRLPGADGGDPHRQLYDGDGAGGGGQCYVHRAGGGVHPHGLRPVLAAEPVSLGVPHDLLRQPADAEKAALKF